MSLTARQIALLVATASLAQSIAAAIAIVATLHETTDFESIMRAVDNNAASLLYMRSVIYEEECENV